MLSRVGAKIKYYSLMFAYIQMYYMYTLPVKPGVDNEKMKLLIPRTYILTVSIYVPPNSILNYGFFYYCIIKICI